MVPIDQLTAADIAAMVGRDAESMSLEFKVDIPLHAQNQKEQLSRNVESPRDQWWFGKSIAAHGRDELLAEIVAFANASGGRLMVGIEEEEATTIARAIVPLPRIKDLAKRLEDFILSGIEPRLPQYRVRGIEVKDADWGVLAVDIGPSRLGPHRVIGTLAVTVRRGDKCMPMNMGEVHDMVLRNARRFDEVRLSLDQRVGKLEMAFESFLAARAGTNIITPDQSVRVAIWLKQKQLSALAFKVVVCAHDDLGLSRLATFDPFVPDKRCIAEVTTEGHVPSTEMVGFWPEQGHGERFLGGFRGSSDWDTGLYSYEASREGIVEQTFLLVGAPATYITPAQVAGFVGGTLAIFDRLRVAAGRPDMPGEVAASFLSHGPVRIGLNQLSRVLDGCLPAKGIFPRRTVASAEDISLVMEQTVQDVLDAANDRSPRGPRYVYRSSIT